VRVSDERVVRAKHRCVERCGALVRAGLLGQVREVEGKFEAVWSNELGRTMVQNFGRESEAVQHVARNQRGGLRFHDLRHSYGTWLADDGIVPNKLREGHGARRHRHNNAVVRSANRGPRRDP
jgi:integrase